MHLQTWSSQETQTSYRSVNISTGVSAQSLPGMQYFLCEYYACSSPAQKQTQYGFVHARSRYEQTHSIQKR